MGELARRPIQRHDCRPPTAAGRPIEDGTWTCPECGEPWHVGPRRSSNPAYVVEMMSPMGAISAEWLRGHVIQGRNNGATQK